MSGDVTILWGRTNGQKWRVYYYQGNFFLPHQFWGKKGPVRAAINRWKRENRVRVNADRAHPKYKTLLQLEALGP